MSGPCRKLAAGAKDQAQAAIPGPQRQAQGFDRGAPARVKFDTPHRPGTAGLPDDLAELATNDRSHLRCGNLDTIEACQRSAPAPVNLRANQTKAPFLITDPLQKSDHREDTNNRHRVEALAIRHALVLRKQRPRR